MTERRVSVRLAAVGGQVLKADLREIGREGRAALETIGAAGAPASRGLDDVGASASAAITRFEALSARAAQAAVNLRAAAASTGTLAGRVDALTGVSSGVDRSAADITAYGSALDDLRARHNPLFAAIRSYRGALDDIRQAHRVGAISADEMTAAIGRERTVALANIAALKGRTTALGQMGGASRLASYQSRNLLYQLNDVGVSLASGMNPMMVFIQQGSQISQIYAGQGGVNAALKQTAGLVLGVARAHPVATAAVIATGVALAGLRHEITEASGVTVGFGDTALAVWQVIRDGLVSVLKPAIDAIAPWFSAAWDVVVAGVHVTGNAIINGFRLAIETVKRLFAALPLIAGAAVIGAANAVLTGIEKLITAALARMNGFIQTVSGLVAKIPGMEGFSLGEIAPPPPLRKIDNSYAADLTAAWQDFERVHAEIQASDPMGDFFDAVKVRAVKNALDDTAEAAGGAGAAMKQAGGAAKDGMDAAKTSVDTVSNALAKYAEDAKAVGKNLGDSLAGAFTSAEEAVGNFVKTGKLDIRDLVTSMLADLAKLSVKQAILGPLAGALSGLFGGAAASPNASLGSIFAGLFHDGGRVGAGGRIAIPAAAILAAPRFHNGGGFGLRSDEQVGVLQRGERVLNRRQTRDWEAGGAPNITINARDAASFRQSQSQIAADIARAVAAGRRSL
ncbi:phage tail tape measure C-terminal domain-containing protein [uncultured Amaricoccus sp.]|uniref:phage tail tape measure C-terminal domain-containing protein n=1 Tax=uncultured Amaricoccus sp. TaxID=339341 RepID=UPI00260359C9|nr:phage tail tape measure C-terminal domain-containing protein [uncultured Amaricoccus sp.]